MILTIYNFDAEETVARIVLSEDGSLKEQLANLKNEHKYIETLEFKNIVLEPLARWNRCVVQFVCSLEPNFLVIIEKEST